MPNKSDSAGKIHEFFSYIEIKRIFWIDWKSPYDKNNTLSLDLFSKNELENLQKCSALTASLIQGHILKLYPWDKPVFIHHADGAEGFDDTKDIKITLKSGIKVWFSLKCFTSAGSVLSKNMWAWSLIKTYFGSIDRQEEFDIFFKSERLKYLNSIFQTNYEKIWDINAYIRDRTRADGHNKDRFEHYPQANEHRSLFLKKLQTKLQDIMKELPIENLLLAAKYVMDSNGNIIYATYGEWNITAIPSQHTDPLIEDYRSIRTRGNDSVVISFSNYEVGFRYKFESSITSSIKLVWDYSFL